MSVVIRLARAGNRNRAFWRVVAADSRMPRDGRYIEKLGYYDPIPKNEKIQIDSARVDYWVSKGAQISDSVKRLLKRMERKALAVAAGPVVIPITPPPVEVVVPEPVAAPKVVKEPKEKKEPEVKVEAEAKAEAEAEPKAAPKAPKKKPAPPKKKAAKAGKTGESPKKKK